MEGNPCKTEMKSNPYAAFVHKVKTTPLEPISGGKAGFVEGKDYFEFVKKSNSLDFLLKKTEAEASEFKQERLRKEQDLPFMNSFLIELVSGIKITLSSIYNATVLATERPDDEGVRKRSHNQVINDIRRIDSVLNSLLNFININTPIAKTNTLSTILEEVLEANEKQLREKNIQVIRRCEKDLPETYIHNEQVKFILHSVLQFAIFSTPRNTSIGFLMKALDFHDAMDTKKDSPEMKKGYVEMVVNFDGDVKFAGPLENLLKLSEDQRQATDLILVLVNEILTKNRGSMSIESNGKRPKTLITLRVPIERRNVVYYAPIAL
jgi:hypothetical protein